MPSIYEVYQQVHKRKPDGLLRWKAYLALVSAVVMAFAYAVREARGFHAVARMRPGGAVAYTAATILFVHWFGGLLGLRWPGGILMP